MNIDKTKNNHFVPRFYLKSFLDNDECIYQVYIQENKPITIQGEEKLKEVCRGKNLYTVKNKITDDDISLYKQHFLENYKIPENYLFLLKNYLNDTLGDLIDIKCSSNKVIEEYLNKKTTDINAVNEARTQENIFTFIYENNSLYQELLKTEELLAIKKTSSENFLVYSWLKLSEFIYTELNKKMCKVLLPDDPLIQTPKTMGNDNFYDLVIFLFMQYFRTKKIKTKIIQELKNVISDEEKCEHLYFLFLHIQPILIANSCINDNYKFILIKNKSNIDFITSDSPSINLYSSLIENRPLYDNEIELYFPLSPKIALLFTNRECYTNISVLELKKENDIKMYNKAIINEAHSCIYSDSEQLLQQYM